MYIPADSQVIANLATVGGAKSAERQAEALGGALEVFRNYLTLLARRELAPDLAAKVGASDLVQETFLAAGRDIARLRGRSPAELRSWLEGILQHLLANTRRRYRGTRKRRVDLEVPGCGGAGAARGDLVATISVSATSPSGRAMRREREDSLCAALSHLPEHYRQVIEWHHREGLPFPAIAERLGISPEAARKIWARALLRLREALGPGHDPR
jgi:RNA polymerase sigma-70 factor, ECF subfamily